LNEPVYLVGHSTKFYDGRRGYNDLPPGLDDMPYWYLISLGEKNVWKHDPVVLLVGSLSAG
jgi:hypothetical protein